MNYDPEKLPTDGLGRISCDYEPSEIEIKIARDAICREFGNNGTDGYYIRILKAIHSIWYTNGFRWIDKPAMISGHDFMYRAQVLCSFPKSNGKVRYIVEDNGRLFIQREEQITYIDLETGVVPPDQPVNAEEERVRKIYEGVTDQNSADKEMQIAMGLDPVDIYTERAKREGIPREEAKTRTISEMYHGPRQTDVKVIIELGKRMDEIDPPGSAEWNRDERNHINPIKE